MWKHSYTFMLMADVDSCIGSVGQGRATQTLHLTPKTEQCIVVWWTTTAVIDWLKMYFQPNTYFVCTKTANGRLL